MACFFLDDPLRFGEGTLWPGGGSEEKNQKKSCEPHIFTVIYIPHSGQLDDFPVFDLCPSCNLIIPHCVFDL